MFCIPHPHSPLYLWNSRTHSQSAAIPPPSLESAVKLAAAAPSPPTWPWPFQHISSLHSARITHQHRSRSPLAVSPPLLPLELASRSSICLCRSRSTTAPRSPAFHPPPRCSHRHPLLRCISPSPLQRSGKQGRGGKFTFPISLKQVHFGSPSPNELWISIMCSLFVWCFGKSCLCHRILFTLIE